MSLGIGGEVVAKIKALVEVDTKEMTRGLAKANAELDKSAGKMKHTGNVAGKVAATGIGLLAAGMYESVKAASEQNDAHEQLVHSMKKVGLTAQSITGYWQDMLQKQSEVKDFTEKDLTTAFARLVPMVGNPEMAFKALNAAMDISSKTGKPLAATTIAVGKALNGTTAGLARYGVLLKTGSNQQQVLAQIQKKYGGAAADQAKTLSGRVGILKNQIEILAVSIGEHLIPPLSRAAKWLTEHKNVLKVLIGLIVGVTAVAAGWWAVMKLVDTYQKLATVSSKVFGAATRLLGGSMATTAAETEAAGGQMALFGEEAAAAGTATEGAAVASTAALGPLAVAVVGVAAGYELWTHRARTHVTVTDTMKHANDELSQSIDAGGKSVKGWNLIMGTATDRAQKAASSIDKMGQSSIPGVAQAAGGLAKKNLGTFISQMQGVAAKAEAASHDTADFGAAARAQYAHVAALAKTSADLAAAMGRIPDRKYVQLVVSVTENLKTEGLAPGQGSSAHSNHADGGLITGGTPGKDSVPAMLTPGEIVLNAGQQSYMRSAYGVDVASVLGFADGGKAPTKAERAQRRAARRQRKHDHLDRSIQNAIDGLDFQLQLDDRIASRDDSEGDITGELRVLGKMQKIREHERAIYAGGIKKARRHGFGDLVKSYTQASAFVNQDILDTTDTIKGLRGQSGGGGGSGDSAQIASFLSAFADVASSFGLTFFGGPGIGAPAPAAAASGGAPTVHVHQTMHVQHDNQPAHMRSARFAAQAAFA